MNSCLHASISRTFASFCMIGLLVVSPMSSQQSAPAHDDAAMHRFVGDLMKKMTLEEKIGQMSQIANQQIADSVLPNATREEQITRGNPGSFLFVKDPAEIDHLQHVAVEQTRLHIPLLFGFDVIHGYRTINPVPIAMAASWDPALVERSQMMAAREASAVGVRWAFAPMVDIARDPRWGRIMEGAGEDPYLGARIAEAQVWGFQGRTLGAPDRILASVKHFAGYGAAAGGRDYDESNISDEQLQNLYLPPFHAAEKAGAATFMAAYMNLNGVPATGNRFLIHDVLRGEWGFQGFVVSDWESVKNLKTHGYAADDADAAARAVYAGVDMEMTSSDYYANLAADLKNGKVTQTEIDDSVRRILEAKYKLGLFEHPYAVPGLAAKELVSPEHRAAAREAAQRTAVLLRNEGDVLPLKKSVKSIAVIGALADSKPDTMGGWSLAGVYEDTVTILAGIRSKVGSGVTVKFERGVEIERTTSSIFDPQFKSPASTLVTAAQKSKAFSDAVDAAKAADVAVLVMGELQSMNGEYASRATLTLPGDQERLLEAVVATGKPVVLLLMSGRPLEIGWAAEHVPAIMDIWHPGTEGGNAVADLLFGDANPGGKLPMTWPRTVGQVPIYYGYTESQNPKERGQMYWDEVSTPQYPFGFGLSYSKFTMGHLQLSANELRAGGSLNATVDLENTSAVDGDEVVQLYTHQRAGSAARPVRELKGFERVHLKAGEHRSVTIPLHADDLKFWSASTHKVELDPGEFDIWVGDSSQASEHGTFTVTIGFDIARVAH
jgi:beta-glucosidase